MKKSLYNFISIALVLSFIFSMSINSYSLVETKYDINNKIIDALQTIEFAKDKMGLTNVNFEDIEISEKPINSYVYANNCFEKRYEFFPLFSDDELIAFAIKKGTGSDSTYQITTELVSKIADKYIVDSQVALLYDDDSCFLYNGNELILLTNFIEHNSERNDIATNKGNIDFSTVQTNNIGQIRQIGYVNQSSSRIPIYYECDVEYVPQAPYENICWAASISSIVGYLLNTEPDDAEFVARFHYGDDFNRRLPRQDAVVVLGYYDVHYSFCNTVPSGSVIYRNIINGYPLYTSFVSSSSSHAVVLYGIHVTSSIYYIMDPLFGFCSVTYKSGVGYTYVNPNSNTEFVFSSATCMYLTV